MLLHLVRFYPDQYRVISSLSEQKPDAIVSLVHDSEWCDHLPDVSPSPLRS